MIFNVLVQDRSVNFIAFVISPWHLISLEASLSYLNSFGRQMNGIVCVVKHPKTGYTIKKQEELQVVGAKYVCFTDNYYISCEKRMENSVWKSFIQHRKQNYHLLKHICIDGINWYGRSTVYVMSPWVVNFSVGVRLGMMHYFVRYVILDEGIGNYLGDGVTKKKVASFTSMHQWKTYFMHNVMPYIWIPKFHHIFDARAFELQSNGKCVLKSSLQLYYKQAIIKHSNRIDNSFFVGGKVIICTSVVYDGVFQNAEDIRVWQELCKTLYCAGIKMILKPHPRDNFFASFAESWHCELIGEGYTLEEICAISKPLAVIGHHSTALVTVNAFFGVPAICVTDLFDSKNVSEKFMEGAERYKYIFSRMVQYPQNYDECVQMINSQGA